VISILRSRKSCSTPLQEDCSGSRGSSSVCNLKPYVDNHSPPVAPADFSQPQFEVRVNVLLFTLPSNVAYISQTLAANNLYLLDPVPPYDPTRHSDRPEYRNAHGGHDMALRMMIMAQRGRLPGQGSEMMTLGQMDKAKQVEVQRRQVDEVFRTLADGQELEMCCPGGSEQPSV